MNNKFLLFFLIIFLSPAIFSAENITIDNINQQDIDDLTEELAANFVYTNVSSAKVTGDLIPVIGFELGVVLGVTDAPSWKRIISEKDSSTEFDKLPYGNIFLSASFKPLNLSFDFAFIPETSSDNAFIKNMAFAVKWTFMDGTEGFPILMAVKAHTTSNELRFTDTINNASTGNTNIIGTTSFDTSIYGIQLLSGFDLVVFEPYIGIGLVKSKTKTKLTATGTTSIFDQNVTLNAKGEAKSSHSSIQLLAGLALDFFIPNLGFEYMLVNGTNKFSFKFGLSF